MTTDEIEGLTRIWEELLAVLDYQSGHWYHWHAPDSMSLKADLFENADYWEEIDESVARKVIRDLGFDDREDQRVRAEVESLRPLTIIDVFRLRDREATQHRHGRTDKQMRRDEARERFQAGLRGELLS